MRGRSPDPGRSVKAIKRDKDIKVIIKEIEKG